MYIVNNMKNHKRLAYVSLFLYIKVMKKYIEVKLDIEGLHHWPDCNLPHVEYLAHLHRHTFVINCRHEVTDSNREIEFIDFKHKIKQYIAKRW